MKGVAHLLPASKPFYRVVRTSGFPRTPRHHIGRLGLAWQAGREKVFWCVVWDGQTTTSLVRYDQIKIIGE